MLLAFLLSCAHVAPTVPPAPPLAVSEPIAPRPFTVDELRAGIPQGTRIRLQIATLGEPTIEQRWEFLACTADGATITSQVYDAAGVLLKDEGPGTSTWAELNEHATFPAAATVRTEQSLDGPLGSLDTWLYTVALPGDDGILLVKRLYFSKSLPGPPVLLTIERQGVETFRMTMLERG